jgi:hypothetical protein
MLFVAPGFLPYVGLLACGVLFIFGLQGYPLLTAVAGFAHFVDGTMIHDGLQPVAHVAILCLVGGGFAPDRKKCFLPSLICNTLRVFKARYFYNLNDIALFLPLPYSPGQAQF